VQPQPHQQNQTTSGARLFLIAAEGGDLFTELLGALLIAACQSNR
jgi:hypothetical protein